MRVDVQKNKPGFCTAVPHGPIDSSTYEDFQKQINHLLAPGVKNLLIDLVNVDYISSAGLGVLFSLKKSLGASGGELGFCNLKPQIKKLFEIVKALPKENIFESEKEADRYFYKMMNDEIDNQRKKS